MAELIEWYNKNACRNFPFAEDSDRKADDGNILPNDFIADLGIVCAYGADSEFVRLLNWSVTPLSVTLVFGRGTVPVAYLMVTLASLSSSFQQFELTGINGLASGKIVLKKPAEALPAGQHRYGAGMEVEARAVRWVRRPGVSRFLRTLNGASIKGVVDLDFDQTLLAATVSGTALDPVITLSLLNAAAFKSKCQADESTGKCPQGSPLRSINNVVKGSSVAIKGCTTISPQPVTVAVNSSTDSLIEISTVLQRSTLCAARTRKMPEPGTGRLPGYENVNPVVFNPSHSPTPPPSGCNGPVITSGTVAVTSDYTPPYVPRGGTATIHVNNTTASPVCTQYSISCGDGTTLNGQMSGASTTVTHVWNHPGNYTVNLAMWNDSMVTPYHCSTTITVT